MIVKELDIVNDVLNTVKTYVNKQMTKEEIQQNIKSIRNVVTENSNLFNDEQSKHLLIEFYFILSQLKIMVDLEINLENMINNEIEYLNTQINQVSNLKEQTLLSNVSLDTYNDSNSINASDVYNSNYKNKNKRSNYPKVVSKILKNWLRENMNNPYPTESEKSSLMEATGLDSTQINNWFINARRRILPFMKSKFSQYY
ncbi:HD2 [Hepatospora eriocheir]|uniref:HD2 n=1 Tax=Hepatospora eriocheir TaxID=1081669 RepID=A0A1X0QD93_9MICR|nr:HD2 [Hepatospora eriocheir]